MIFITAKFQIKPEDADRWPQISAEFTAATRAEPGCLFFDWSRSLADSTEYVLVEAFRDDDAGAAHVGSDHFAEARRTLPPHLAETPRIINATVPHTCHRRHHDERLSVQVLLGESVWHAHHCRKRYHLRRVLHRPCAPEVRGRARLRAGVSGEMIR